MATYYYDLSLGANGTGTPASPFNGSVWPGHAFAAGDSHLFKRGTTGTLAFTITAAGTSVAPLVFNAWFNSDGTDDGNQPRPIINTTTVLTAFGTAKDWIILANLQIVSSGIVAASDKPLFFCGSNNLVIGNIIDSNVGGVGIWDKDNVEISFNTIKAVSHSTSFNNQALAIVNSAAHSNYTVHDNTFRHYGGGGITSHCVACYDTDGLSSLSNLTLRNNAVTTSTNTYNANHSAIGIRILNGGSCAIESNICSYFQVGIFCAGGAGSMSFATLVGNTCKFNYHFGIGITTGTSSFTIDRNTCNYNGTSTNDGILLAYGRGIELSSAAGQGSCTSHTLTHNICTNNYNYGGPNDNASEGVGIGLDDGAVDCLVMANTLTDNEGNGIQCYGGGNNATWTNTHNYIYSNILRNNCTNNYISRRSGGTHRSGSFNADIALSYIHGGPSAVVNNTFAGNTPVGISTDGNCDQLQYGNNIFLFIDHPITTALTPAANDYRNSIFRAPVQTYSTTAVDGNGEATFPLLSYNGNVDFVTNPGLDANYHIISTSSNAYRGGVQFVVVGSPTYTDFGGSAFNPVGAAPSIGAYEFIPDGTLLGGHDRKMHDRSRS